MRKSRKARPTEEELRDVADVDVAAGRKVGTGKAAIPKGSVGPTPRAVVGRAVPQPKAVGRNRKARTTARKSDMNAARKPRQRRAA